MESGQEIGNLVVAGRPRPGNRLLLGDPGIGKLLPERSLEDRIDRVAHDLRADHVEEHADHGEHDDAKDQGALRPQRSEQSPERPTEVLRLGRRHAHPQAHHPGTATTARTSGPTPGSARPAGAGPEQGGPGPVCARRSRSAAHAIAAGTTRPACSVAVASLAHATASAWDSCE